MVNEDEGGADRRPPIRDSLVVLVAGAAHVSSRFCPGASFPPWFEHTAVTSSSSKRMAVLGLNGFGEFCDRANADVRVARCVDGDGGREPHDARRVHGLEDPYPARLVGVLQRAWSGRVVGDVRIPLRVQREGRSEPASTVHDFGGPSSPRLRSVVEVGVEAVRVGDPGIPGTVELEREGREGISLKARPRVDAPDLAAYLMSPLAFSI